MKPKLLCLKMHDSVPVETLVERINAGTPEDCVSVSVVHEHNKTGHRWVFVYYWG